MVSFKIANITEPGNVIVDAWLSIDNAQQKEIVYDKTWAEGTCGPWIFIDPEGRKIKMMPYVPKYMKDTQFNEFVRFTELFLNSMYKSMSNNKNIGILEKVARIGDFNFIDKIEKPLIKHYREEFAIEIEPNLDEIQKFLMQKRIARSDSEGVIVAENFAYNEFDDNDLYDFMKYIYREIPEYNQYKGSYKGIKMALNVLGMCVKIVELWARTNDAQIDDMMRADDLNDYPLKFNKSDKAIIAKYYLTSRFDVDMEETDISFKDFNDLADNIVRLIFQVKPVTRLLRKLSYIYYMWIDIHFSYLWYPEYNVQELTHYKYKWDLSDYDSFKKHRYSTISGKLGTFDVSDNIQYINQLYIPFKAKEGLCSWISRADHAASETTESTTSTTTKTCSNCNGSGINPNLDLNSLHFNFHGAPLKFVRYISDLPSYDSSNIYCIENNLIYFWVSGHHGEYMLGTWDNDTVESDAPGLLDSILNAIKCPTCNGTKEITETIITNTTTSNNDGSVAGNRVVRTKFTTNSYLTLFNIGHKVRVSDLTKLRFKIDYSYKHTYYEMSPVQVPTGTIYVPISKEETISKTTDVRDIDLWDFTNGEIPNDANTVYLEEDDNGFYINFLGTSHAALSTLGLNESLIKNKKITFGNSTDPLSLHIYTLTDFNIIMCFDCALGTDYIGQGICDDPVCDITYEPDNELYLATLGDTDSYKNKKYYIYPYTKAPYQK